MSEELKSAIIGVLAALAVLLPKWLQVRLKRTDVAITSDRLTVEQGLAVLDTIEILKADRDELKKQLETIIALDSKLEEKHQRLLTQNADLETRCTLLEKELAVAKGQVYIINTIAEKLTLNLHLAPNGAKINDKEKEVN